MRRFLGLVLALAVGVTTLADAQRRAQAQKKPFLGNPAFVAQPGMIGALNGSGLNVNARFVTAIPTSISRTTLIGIIQWTPFADEDNDDAKENTPAFVYGPVVNLVNNEKVSFDIDGLFAYGPSGTVPPKSFYTHKFLIEGDLFIKVGRMMNMEAASRFRNLNVYVLLAYVLTGLDDGVGTGTLGEVTSKDRSVLLVGLSLPIAP
ncbi:MAG: hypothetical protein ACREL9_12055 [Gemmatimonadales bacterium]